MSRDKIAAQSQGNSGRRGLSGVPLVGDALAMLRLFRDGEGRWYAKLMIAFAFLYVVSPVDAIPDVIMPIFAWLDDLGFFLAVRLLLHEQLQRYRYPVFGAKSRRLEIPRPDHPAGYVTPEYVRKR